MQIPYSLINFYLSQITVGYFSRNELPPDDVTGYADQLVHLEGLAIQHRELEPLRLGLEYLLSHPEIDTRELNGGRYPLNDRRVREIMHYVWKSLWPDAEPVPPGGPENVHLVRMSLEQWRSSENNS